MGPVHSSRDSVWAELSLGLVRPGGVVVPLMASLHYTAADPYAVQMAFHVGTGEPVEWALARDLLASALHARAGIGDVQAWPSAAPEEPGILHLVMSSPFGHAQFEAPAGQIEAFLDRSFRIVPAGQESALIDFDAELSDLLSEA